MCIRDRYGEHSPCAMGVCASTEDQPSAAQDAQEARFEAASEARRLKVSESALIDLQLTAPTALTLQMRRLDTVGKLLGLTAVKLGLLERHSDLLQIVIDNQIEIDYTKTMEEAGLLEHKSFQVRGIEGARAKAVVEANSVHLFSKHVLAHGAEQVYGVELVCQFAPRRVYERDADGFTPLHYAAARNGARTATLLMGAGADTAWTSKHGTTPLHMAAQYNSTEVATLLIAAKADVNAMDENGLTPLYWASDSANQDGHHHDGQHGASFDSETLGHKEGHSEMIKLLLNAGAARTS
eukprot:TRINITY_DN7386_c0_g1_i2.p1 TRINITY_DN7386_c0_g1~~TRINITY_DN7386_c0_g1_i2.p1  ORF type:complete len:296 (+),score=64.49 TRINITY_DN7386_c0_g1_i2:97-984(+)